MICGKVGEGNDSIHFRHEHKYVMPDIDLIATQHRLCAIMDEDSHAVNGTYSIRSLYFDDHKDRFLNENIDGVDDRTKWRIRIYDRRSDFISLERKIRKSDLISKQSCEIDIDTFRSIMNRQISVVNGNASLLNEFIGEMKMKALHPAIIIEYERTPLVCKAGNTRVTFDRCIRSSSELDGFLSERHLASRPVLMSGQSLLEVKYDEFLPDHVAHTIGNGCMRRETFSKYYLARKFTYDGLTKAVIRRIQ